MHSCSKVPRLDYRELLRISSETPERCLPRANSTVLAWQPHLAQTQATPSTSAQQEQSTATQHCQIAFLSTEERIRYSDKYLNTCNNCEARVWSYCYPRCFLQNESDDKQFYCLTANRNCFNEKHERIQPDNRIPVHCSVSRCHKCKMGSSRFKCNQCDKRFCLINGKGCFYSAEHIEDCQID